jgi:N-methylhydantoinase A
MIFSAEGSAVLTPVYDGEKLGARDVIEGPAVIEEPTTTVVISPGWTARLDESGTYVITRNAL